MASKEKPRRSASQGIFRAEDAAIPFVTRNAELLEMLAPQFDQELKDRAANEDHFIDLVRGAIQQRLTGHRPVVDDVAKDLHMSPRTLQRRLQDVGSNYQRVLEEARHQMARYYLSNSVFELGEAGCWHRSRGSFLSLALPSCIGLRRISAGRAYS